MPENCPVCLLKGKRSLLVLEPTAENPMVLCPDLECTYVQLSNASKKALEDYSKSIPDKDNITFDERFITIEDHMKALDMELLRTTSSCIVNYKFVSTTKQDQSINTQKLIDVPKPKAADGNDDINNAGVDDTETLDRNHEDDLTVQMQIGSEQSCSCSSSSPEDTTVVVKSVGGVKRKVQYATKAVQTI